MQRTLVIKAWKCEDKGAMVVTQLAGQLLPASEDLGSKQAIGIFWKQQLFTSNKNKEKKVLNGPLRNGKWNQSWYAAT